MKKKTNKLARRTAGVPQKSSTRVPRKKQGEGTLSQKSTMMDVYLAGVTSGMLLQRFLFDSPWRVSNVKGKIIAKKEPSLQKPSGNARTAPKRKTKGRRVKQQGRRK